MKTCCRGGNSSFLLLVQGYDFVSELEQQYHRNEMREMREEDASQSVGGNAWFMSSRKQY